MREHGFEARSTRPGPLATRKRSPTDALARSCRRDAPQRRSIPERRDRCRAGTAQRGRPRRRWSWPKLPGRPPAGTPPPAGESPADREAATASQHPRKGAATPVRRVRTHRAFASRRTSCAAPHVEPRPPHCQRPRSERDRAARRRRGARRSARVGADRRGATPACCGPSCARIACRRVTQPTSSRPAGCASSSTSTRSGTPMASDGGSPPPRAGSACGRSRADGPLANPVEDIETVRGRGPRASSTRRC